MWVCALCEASERGTMVVRSSVEADICTYCENELKRQGRRYCRTGKHSSSDFPSPAYRTCRACINDRRRTRYHDNLDERRAALRDYYAAHPEQERTRSLRYRNRHIERVRANDRHRYHTKPEVRERKLTGALQWCQRNRAYCLNLYRLQAMRRKLRILRQIRGT
jgi:hypothetical protein